MAWFLFLFIFTINIYGQDLPEINLDYASYALSEEGKLIGYYGEKRRVEVKSLKNISPYIIDCLIATEDRDFYNHDGVSLKGLVRGILKTITGSTQGGSTITMQLARNLFLTHDRTVSRKLTEIDIAYKLEQKYSKDEILLLYLNTVYFGHSVYGVWAAAQEYFSLTPDKLSVTQSAAIVGLLQNPGGYNPDKNPVKLLNRRNEVLYNLVETGKLSDAQFKKLKKEPLNLKIHGNTGRHFLEHIRKEASEILKEKKLSLNKDQLKITTTLDYEIQTAAENAIREQWSRFPKSMKEAEAALISVEPGTGKIKAMVGGNPESPARGLNRSVQSRRQPGSSFKIFLYGNLLEQGYTLATPLIDTPIVIDEGKAWEWRPGNSDNSFTGLPMPMIDAIENSINLSAAYAITELTSPDSVAAFAHQLGIESVIPALPSIALGSAEVTPVEMAASAAVYASQGIYAATYSITKIEDNYGRVIYSSDPFSINVLDSATAYLLTAALQKAVNSGTAAPIRKYYKGPAAGKTGTTQNYTDAWFVGYNPNLSTAIWIGFDNQAKKLSSGYQYGGTACAPIFGRMYSVIEKKKKGFTEDFPRPSNVVEKELCLDTGWLPEEGCTNKKMFLINEDKIPPFIETEFFDIHYGW